MALRRPLIRSLALRPSTGIFRPYSTANTPTETVNLSYHLHEAPYTDARNSAPILFLHGLFGSKQNNRSISKMLARELGRPIYALDLRNHGDSPHSPIHNYESMAGDIESFITQHSISNPTLIGHSMGAKVVMAVALRKNVEITDIIAVDNAPVNAQLGRKFANYVLAMRQIEEKGVVKQSEANQIFKEYEGSLPIRQFLLTNIVRPPPTSETPYLRFRIPVKTLATNLDAMAGFPYTPGDWRFDKPALFVRGTQSRYVADETIPLIGEFFPRFQIADVEAGHWLISENVEGFKKVVLEFLRRDQD